MTVQPSFQNFDSGVSNQPFPPAPVNPNFPLGGPQYPLLCPPQSDFGVMQTLNQVMHRLGVTEQRLNSAEQNDHGTDNQLHRINEKLSASEKTLKSVSEEQKKLQELTNGNAAYLLVEHESAVDNKSQTERRLRNLECLVEKLNRELSDIQQVAPIAPKRSCCSSRVLPILLTIITLLALAALIVFILCACGCIPGLSSLIMGSVIGATLGSSTFFVLSAVSASVCCMSYWSYFLFKSSK